MVRALDVPRMRERTEESAQSALSRLQGVGVDPERPAAPRAVQRSRFMRIETWNRIRLFSASQIQPHSTQTHTFAQLLFRCLHSPISHTVLSLSRLIHTLTFHIPHDRISYTP